MALATDEAAKAGNNRIQVSNTKKPLFFYVNLSKVRASWSETERSEDLVRQEHRAWTERIRRPMCRAPRPVATTHASFIASLRRCFRSGPV
eukprot:scaffold576_cov336-Pavlova_lutheri.AAC.9